MKIKSNNLFKNITILSIPGILSIFISFLSIPIHLNIAGPENYGNYIIFHFILLFAINLNFGNRENLQLLALIIFLKKKKEISFKAIEYTIKIAVVIIILFFCLYNF